MEKLRIQIYDCNTGEHIDREMTDAEYAEWLAQAQEEPTELEAPTTPE